MTKCLPDADDCKEDYYCDEQVCVPKKANGAKCTLSTECQSEHCDKVCCQSDGGPCCEGPLDCSAPTEICSAEHLCVSCAKDDRCAEQYSMRPHCQEGECVECTEHAHCQDGDFDSPVGACTPTNKCTCWVPKEDPRWGDCDDHSICDEISQKTGEEFLCARDTNITGHFVCLRKCDSEKSPESGIECRFRETIDDKYGSQPRFWAPMTTCFAFIRYGKECDKITDCSALSTNFYEGYCLPNQACTYGCQDDNNKDQDSWCPKNNCNTSYHICD